MRSADRPPLISPSETSQRQTLLNIIQSSLTPPDSHHFYISAEIFFPGATPHPPPPVILDLSYDSFCMRLSYLTTISGLVNMMPSRTNRFHPGRPFRPPQIKTHPGHFRNHFLDMLIPQVWDYTVPNCASWVPQVPSRGRYRSDDQCLSPEEVKSSHV